MLRLTRLPCLLLSFLLICLTMLLPTQDAQAVPAARPGMIPLDTTNTSAITASSRPSDTDTLTSAQKAIRHPHRGYLAFNLGKTPRWANLGLLGYSDKVSGIQFNALGSAANHSGGLQFSGLTNIAGKLHGVQVAGLSNVCSSPFRGLQLASVSNVSMGVKRGTQLAALVNITSSRMRGLQVAIYNYADTLSGSQVGFFNSCMSHPRGVQIGLVNFSRDTVAHKVGLVNVNPKTKIDLLGYIGTSSKFNLAVRFRNRSTYNIIGFGTHYMGLDKKFSGALFYRIGQYFNVSPHLSLSGDIGYYHIETFEQHSEDSPERLFSMQAHLNADYSINSALGLMASIGWGDTRHYYHWRHYRNRPLVEAGLTVNLRPQHLNDDSPNPSATLAQIEQTAADSIYAFNDPRLIKPRPWRAALQAFGINVLVQSFDRFVMNEDFAQINLHTIHHNFKHGFVWDNDQFSTNLFAHPYHGGLYFNSARCNGLNFWQSVPYSLCGSLMWEMTCEIEPPAINDLMATTIGGVCLGEVTHRLSALVLDDRDRGMKRFLRELAGAVICPIRAFNRIVTGRAWQVSDKYYKYHDYTKLPVTLALSAGNRYLADQGGLFRGESNPYLDVSIAYGDPMNMEQNSPYDYFTANVTFGLSGNQPLISGIHLLGRLWGAQVSETEHLETQAGIFQHFNYYDSKAVKDGTDRVPFRISEAAAAGPGLIMRFKRSGSMRYLQQSFHLSGILLGGSMSDYYNVIDRDYNMGSGFSVKSQTLLQFGPVSRFLLAASYYNIFTWKGYEHKDLDATDPLYLNAQGDHSNARLTVVSPRMYHALNKHLSLELSGSYYLRKTHYKYYPNVTSQTFEVRFGINYVFY